MRVIYTCPKCGSDLEEMILTTYPAQHRVYCPNCMWSHDGCTVRIPYDGVLRIPYTDKDDILHEVNTSTPQDSTPLACRSCPNHPNNGGSGVCHCTLGISYNIG